MLPDHRRCSDWKPVERDGEGGPRRRLNVLFITPWYPARGQPVAGTFVREHARAIQLYDEVVILHAAGKKQGLPGLWQMERETHAEIHRGIPTYRVWDRRLPVLRAAYPSRVWGIWQACRRIAQSGFRPDIVHAHVFVAGLPAAIVSRWFHCPMVITEHASVVLRHQLSSFDLLLARLGYRAAARVMPVSHPLEDAVRAYGIDATFQVVPNVIDTELFRPALPRPEDSEATKRLLFVGMASESDLKGISYLFRALGRLDRRDWRLDMIGGGTAQAEFEQLAAELNIAGQVEFRGQRTKAETAAFMQRCDFLVSASLFETFGVVLAEALACGKPVVATESGGPADFVTPEVGLLVPPRDVTALADAIAHMLDHSREYPPAQLAEYSRSRFAPDVVGQLLDCVYREVLA